MQLGFVIDHSRCIGCHACTVACKAENDVPLGSFRTWVKYTETGAFPQVRRSFAVLRCNQCTEAPCVTICPVRALEKRPDGVVDVDPAACIGCKACMQGCPYDALYINEESGTAEKCHFCVHRTEIGLAPACAVVCPTEAIVPGDFHDPASAVSRLRSGDDLTVRRAEAGTGPNVFYREVSEPAIDPAQTRADGGYLWAGRLPGLQLDAESFDAAQRAAENRARTTYDVDHPAPWGGKVSAYLFTKSLAAGIFLALGLLLVRPAGADSLAPGEAAMLAGLALAFLGLTTLLLVLDLKRPERFLYVVLRPNWSSWLARGSIVLIAYGAALGLLAMLLPILGYGPATIGLLLVGLPLAALTACYTGWLFAQSKGRVLWMRRGLWLHLIVQALVAGAAMVLVLQPMLAMPESLVTGMVASLLAALAAHLAFVLTEDRMAPKRREREFRRAVRLISRGPFAVRHWSLGIALGILVPVLLLLTADSPAVRSVAGAAALVGLYVEEDLLVRAGQALGIS